MIRKSKRINAGKARKRMRRRKGMNIKYYRDPIEYERKKGLIASDLSFERAVSEAMKVLLSGAGFPAFKLQFLACVRKRMKSVSPDLLV